MKILHPFFRTISSSAVVLVLSTAAHAALYGNFVGPNISYLNVDENDSEIAGPPPVTSAPTQLFGAPVLSPPTSDNLEFPDLSFSSLAADGQFDLQDGKLTLDIAPTSPSGTIDSLTFDEGGAWRVVGPVGDASAEATLLFNDLRITSVNNVALATPIIVLPIFTESVTPQDGPPPAPPVPPSGGPGDIVIASNNGDSTGLWDITAAFDLDKALANADITGSITGLSVALDDQLFTQTDAEPTLTLAEIDKKHFIISGITTTTTPSVPEPASISMLLCAGLMMRSPRRSLMARRAKAGSRES